MLFRLSYYSTNLLKKAVSPSKSELRKIILTSGVNNRANGITGGLMFNKVYFGQVLEGEREAVAKLFCKISGDTRHRSVVIVEAGAVTERMFDRWAMGLAEKNETADKLNVKFGFEHGFDPSQMSSANFLEYVFEMISLESKLLSVSIPTWGGERHLV